MMRDDLVEEICTLAEQDGQRLPAPSWHHGKYPDLDGLNRDGDPERDFEQDFPTGYRGCYVVLYCKDVHTAHGSGAEPYSDARRLPPQRLHARAGAGTSRGTDRSGGHGRDDLSGL